MEREQEPFVRVNPNCEIRLSAVTVIYVGNNRRDWTKTEEEYYKNDTVWLLVVGFSTNGVELRDPYKMNVLRQLGKLPEDPKAQQERDDANCVSQG